MLGRRRNLVTPTALIAILAPAVPLHAQSRPIDRARILREVDSIANDALADRRAAGMSVAIVLGRDTLVLKGYGLANLEHQVPTPERAVYEIGSITKQFTAVAILLLAEERKLSLDDEITRFLPDYPTQGHRITIRRLLDHTSGIRSYTEMDGFESRTKSRTPRDSIIRFFAAEPFDFAPGTAAKYSNSAYFLLGAVIEKASGMTYETFLAERLFARAGMPDSHYCDERRVVPRRAHGYDMGSDGLAPKGFIAHTWPFAAGSVCSTAWDLTAWSGALHGGRMLSAESYRALITPESLDDGTRLRYAKGLVVDSISGRRAIHHNGGIPGFLSQMAYLPEEDLTIVVLLNSLGPVDPSALAQRMQVAVLGRVPPAEAKPFDHPATDYLGTYRSTHLRDTLALHVRPDTGGLLRVRRGAQTTAGGIFRYVGNDTFMLGRNRLTFERVAGRIVGLRADFIGEVARLRRTSDATPD